MLIDMKQGTATGPTRGTVCVTAPGPLIGPENVCSAQLTGPAVVEGLVVGGFVVDGLFVGGFVVGGFVVGGLVAGGFVIGGLVVGGLAVGTGVGVITGHLAIVLKAVFTVLSSGGKRSFGVVPATLGSNVYTTCLLMYNSYAGKPS
jgi:hypothetical protein